MRVRRLLLTAPLLSLLILLSVGGSGIVARSGTAASAVPAQSDPRQLDRDARKYYEEGRFDEALHLWQQAAEIYERRGDSAIAIETRINQSLALRALGLYRRAKETLVGSYKTLRQLPDSPLKAAGLRHLGNTLRLVGELGNLDYLDPDCQIQTTLVLDPSNPQSGQVLGESWAIATRLRDPQAIGESLFSFGSVARALFEKERAVENKKEAKQQAQKALACYKKAALASGEPALVVRSRINILNLLVETEGWLLQLEKQEVIRNWLPEIQSQIQSQIATWRDIQFQSERVFPKRTAIYAIIDLAQSLTNLNKQITDNASLKTQFSNVPSWEDIAELLAIAQRQATDLQDPRVESYALGNLGGVYEQTKQWSDAQKLTLKALLLAKQNNAPDIAYKWEWQLGRLLKKQGDIEGAIAAYKKAVESLQFVRQDLASINTEVEFSFREEVEPIYRELVSLLLPPEDPNPSQKNLQESIYYIDSLQLAELENFLRCDPLAIQPPDPKSERSDPTTALIGQINQFSAKNPKTALLYTIILPDDRVAVILKLPSLDTLIYHQTHISKSKLSETIKTARKNLVKPDFSEEDKKCLQVIYKWLIEPFEKTLETNDIDTLVFVLDNELRGIPMAALHDGKQYLVEKKYAVALTSSVQLLKSKPFKRGDLKALIAGAIKARPPEFGPLEFVPKQIESVRKLLRNSEVLLGESFTKKTLKSKMNSSVFNVLHLATHGKFSSDPQETYILTDDKSDAKNEYSININEFGNLLRSRDPSQSIELLVLSACSTANGDKRAVLGLAGVAVKSGADGTIASLWRAEQGSATLLIKEFYENLVNNKEVSKAEALRQAQKSLLDSKKRTENIPKYWAAFVLVGY